jgi:hypothetical protein
LEQLLERAEQEQGKEDQDHLLREMLSLTSTAVEAAQIKEPIGQRSRQGDAERAIGAAAHLKQVRLVIGADKRDDEVQPSPRRPRETGEVQMPKLRNTERSLKPWNGEPLCSKPLEFATYGGRQVLIQWEIAEGIHWEKYKIQMKCLTVLLMSLSDSSFRSLSCMSYYGLKYDGRHGFVFAMPDDEIDYDIKSLRDMILDQQLVSLRRRLEIAKALAETLVQLHTAGWMHKSLRSENVVFLAPRGCGDMVFLSSEPYGVGYEYARSDTPDAAAALTQLPDTELEAELYRHPKSRGANR